MYSINTKGDFIMTVTNKTQNELENLYTKLKKVGKTPISKTEQTETYIVGEKTIEVSFDKQHKVALYIQYDENGTMEKVYRL